MRTYGSCVHPLHQGSRRPHHSAEWRGCTERLNTDNDPQGSDPEEEEFQVMQSGSAPHQNDPYSPAVCHTTSSLGYTGRSTDTGTGPHHRSGAEELRVLTWRCMQILSRVHAKLITLNSDCKKSQYCGDE